MKKVFLVLIIAALVSSCKKEIINTHPGPIYKMKIPGVTPVQTPPSQEPPSFPTNVVDN